MENKVSQYNRANNVAYKWIKLNAGSETFEAEVVNKSIEKFKVALAESIAEAESAIGSAKTNKFLVSFASKAGGVASFGLTAEEILIAEDPKEVARLFTKMAVVFLATEVTAALSVFAVAEFAIQYRREFNYF